MKFFPSQLAYLLSHRDTRHNLKSLVQYVVLLGIIIVAFTVIFHIIMLHLEEQEHSWLTGLYWTLTVMTTLGFGDITFQTDVGRLFSILVLMTGVIMLLIVLPFTFIRFFYAPWLEAQLRIRAPRTLPPKTSGHVIVCIYDEVAEAFIQHLKLSNIPSVVLQSDPTLAANLMSDGIAVLAGDMEDVQTYHNARVSQAIMVLANARDAANCNITLTVREACLDVPIVAVVEDEDAVDVIELSGANHALLMKHKLGEHLAGRVVAGHIHVHIVGGYGPLLIAEFPVQHTNLAGLTIRDTKLRERSGLNIVAFWERGRFHLAKPDSTLNEQSVAVVVGNQEQVASLDVLFRGQHINTNPVLVIGGGNVGKAAINSLRKRKIGVTVIEKDPRLAKSLRQIADQVITGDAADRSVMTRAGIETAPSVLLTANDDAINIFMAVYCRKLNNDIRIISRITRERNLEAIHRAGADFVLSYTTLTASYLMSILFKREVVVLGEGVDVFTARVTSSLAGMTLAESGIGARTGMIVIALHMNGKIEAHLNARTKLDPDAEMIMMGTNEQRNDFLRLFG